MSGNDAASMLTKANRVSIRAVLVPIGEDIGNVLVQHGILDPISIPFAFADESHAALGGSSIPNVIATLELDDTGQGASAPAEPQPANAASRPGLSGAMPLAPVRRLPL
jgi:hypothetical protein